MSLEEGEYVKVGLSGHAIVFQISTNTMFNGRQVNFLSMNYKEALEFIQELTPLVKELYHKHADYTSKISQINGGPTGRTYLEREFK